ncbi:hypothetical protein [Parasitella parasitica]|uniref:Uncharacterized protein n=1 Tax=Parasitella parasitica TaxID=35722 RepID=A0A0B7N8Q3_9FUNG|nr:hypothetical protein [Parasitella parasitica]
MYELPTVKGSSASSSSSSSSSRSTKFEPFKEAFTTLLNEAFRSRLSRTIHANAKKASGEDSESIKATELDRKKVPPGTFEELDAQYGGYWSANTCKRLKMNVLSLYKDFVESSFDELLNLVRENKELVPVEGTRAIVREEQVRSIVVPLNQIVRKDLPSGLRADLNKNLTSAHIWYEINFPKGVPAELREYVIASYSCGSSIKCTHL